MKHAIHDVPLQDLLKWSVEGTLGLKLGNRRIWSHIAQANGSVNYDLVAEWLDSILSGDHEDPTEDMSYAHWLAGSVRNAEEDGFWECGPDGLRYVADIMDEMGRVGVDDSGQVVE